ncbi:hypothetical protein [Meiothermus rufus]|uniref:hypothetical protein n=1 Tax=Meiothermus rufus TaxID=604332 RepID=UPI00040D59D3|nr:hypothetical protein [Meiothermus rufus]
MKRLRSIGIAAYLAFLLERIAQAVPFRPCLMVHPAQVRPCQGMVLKLSLEVPYHPARSARGYVLIPKDGYFHQSEELLQRL